MRHHRTVGPPSKPGHGRGSAPYEPSDSTSRPWGGASWTVEKQRASCKSLSLKHGVTLLDSLLNSLGSWLSGTSLFKHRWSCARNFSACSRSYLNFVSTPTKPTIYSKARRHNIKEQRAERLRTKGKLSVTSRGSSHISRVSTREHPETHEPTHVVSEHKDQSNAFEGNETPSNLLIFNHKQVPLTKSILLIELVESDLNAVTEQ